MRLINLMTLVCGLLMLAMIPACLQFGRLVGGTHSSTSLATLAGITFLVGAALRQR